jgi:hypothetical protein
MAPEDVILKLPNILPESLTSFELDSEYAEREQHTDAFPHELKSISSISVIYHRISNFFAIHPNPPLKELTWQYYNLEDVKQVSRFIRNSQTLEKMTIILSQKSLAKLIRIYPYHLHLKHACCLKELSIEFYSYDMVITNNIQRLLLAVYNDVRKNEKLLNRLNVNGYSLRSALKEFERKDIPKTMSVSSPEYRYRYFSIELAKYLGKP